MGQVCSGAKEESSKGGPLLPSSDADEAGEGGEFPVDPSSTKTTPGGLDDAAAAAATNDDNDNQTADTTGGADGDNANNNTNNDTATTATTAATMAQQRAAAKARADDERRKRKELWIVNGAARGMVAVRSTRGSTGYYDQGFAGLLAQHLEQTTSFPDRLPLVLPAPAAMTIRQPDDTAAAAAAANTTTNTTAAVTSETDTNNEISSIKESKKCTFYDRLAQPPWEGMDLIVINSSNNGGGGGGGESNMNGQTQTQQPLHGREASAAASGDPHRLMDAVAESLLENGPCTVLPAKQQLFAGVRPMVENLL